MQHMLRYLSAGVLAALVFCLLLSGLSFLQPIENILFICLISGLTIVAAVLAAGRLRKPLFSKQPGLRIGWACRKR